MTTFQKIICPIDLSPASLVGLRAAVQLASNAETELCVLHVEPQWSHATPLAGIAPDTHAEAQRRAETITSLSKAIKDLVPPFVSSRPLLKSGEPAEQIVRAAREECADLIVLTTHGTTGFRTGRRGEVADEVLSLAPCPVLVINDHWCSVIHDTNTHADQFKIGLLRPEKRKLHAAH